MDLMIGTAVLIFALSLSLSISWAVLNIKEIIKAIKECDEKVNNSNKEHNEKSYSKDSEEGSQNG